MKVYYISSPRGIVEHGKIYKKTYKILKDLGCELLSDLVLNTDVEEFYAASYKKRVTHYKRTMQAIRNCDVAVIEVSIHSMSMGYIVDKALELGKPVIVLHLKGYEPYFFSGIQNEKLQIYEYHIDDVKEILKQALKVAKENIDVRFNFFISPKIGNYLNWIAKKKKTPRAVYLRRLIEEEMKKNKEYKG